MCIKILSNYMIKSFPPLTFKGGYSAGFCTGLIKLVASKYVTMAQHAQFSISITAWLRSHAFTHPRSTGLG